MYCFNVLEPLLAEYFTVLARDSHVHLLLRIIRIFGCSTTTYVVLVLFEVIAISANVRTILSVGLKQSQRPHKSE
jgi:hypothetical protein